MKLLHLAVGLVSAAALGYGAVCAGLYGFQRSLLYFPQPARMDVPSVRLPVPGADLQVSVRPVAGDKALLYFGGNAEDVSGSLPELASLFPEHSIFLMHYRGYGSSSGQPTEAALHSDAQALWDLASQSHSEITLMGRSLGSGIAMRLASQQASTQRLILVTPYDSIAEVAAAHFPWLPVRWLLKDRFDSAALAPELRVPTWVVSAENDEVIAAERTAALVQRFSPGVVRFTQISKAGHNDLQLQPAYPMAIGLAN
ncbi:hypothetical protein LPB72_20290 [Hydrogenophaga crassostreae]|uniref:AB hydrolase-1 domain-containing protein n=1 Tax=Hydrogenophaga crassostreae TaxID=1763535 RepID=A0A167GL64_9BURK|nr:alpha/beta fold hydrolase [Hydrogenophaga crassostreae]AOW14779.1 hypothetical protein LPB072_20120 [Hydrogenophaga crassostreae]OAD39607.1 hypothetical protein LPB72_20290 [Hydrogenophaga crassostreae]